MAFKKLNTHLLEKLESLGFHDPFPFQKEVISNIKAGNNIYGIGPKDSGKTTALIIGVLQKLNSEAFEDAPRALIVVKNSEAVAELEEAFKVYTRGTDLRVYGLNDERRIDIQRDDIYIGVDIVISTPRRLSKVYFQNGINLGQLKLFIIDDADFLKFGNYSTDLVRLSDSMSKCQYLVFAEAIDQKLERLKESFMSNAIKIKV